MDKYRGTPFGRWMESLDKDDWRWITRPEFVNFERYKIVWLEHRCADLERTVFELGLEGPGKLTAQTIQRFEKLEERCRGCQATRELAAATVEKLQRIEERQLPFHAKIIEELVNKTEKMKKIAEEASGEEKRKTAKFEKTMETFEKMLNTKVKEIAADLLNLLEKEVKKSEKKMEGTIKCLITASRKKTRSTESQERVENLVKMFEAKIVEGHSSAESKTVVMKEEAESNAAIKLH